VSSSSLPPRRPPRRPFVWPETFRALRHPNYRLFWTGALIGNIGSWMRAIALGWLVLDLTGSAFLLGVVSFAQTVPVLLLSLPAGVLADRFERRRVLLVTQACLLVLTFLLALLVQSGLITIGQLMLLSTLMGVAIAFNAPAWQSFITDLVGKDDLMNAIALNSAQFNLSRIVGPALAGVLIAVVGLPLCFFVNAVTYLAVLGALGVMRLRPAARPAGRLALWSGIAEGLAALRDDPPVRALMLLTAVLTIFGFPYAVLMPVIAREALGQGADGYGQLMAATGLGAFAGALAVAARGRRTPSGRVVLPAVGVFAAALLVFALSRLYLLSLAALAVLGAGMIVYMALVNTLIQGRVPEALRGRVMSIWTLTAFGLTPFGSLQAGALAGLFGAPLALGLGAIACAVAAGLLAVLTPGLRAAKLPPPPAATV
jgi:MFS family permease